MMTEHDELARFQPLTAANIRTSPVWQRLAADLQEAILIVSKVLPFRANRYVTDCLIDWSRVPDDPIYQLVFPQREMLDPADYAHIADLVRRRASPQELALAADEIRRSLNPQPAGQVEYNIPLLGGRPLTGCQHKYRETLLFFPAQGQTCHVYCSYCFRWAQFVDLPDLRFSAAEAGDLVAYLRLHPEVQDLLITGGDPMVMKAELLGRYLRPVLAADLPGLRTIRIGTKAVASWPQRFVGEADADPMLRLFEEVVAAGRHLAVMAHYSHPIELSTPVAREAVRRIRRTGAEIRMQSPLIKHVNDDPALWRDLCNVGVALGLIPYYMFVERDTGAKRYFEMPLVQCHAIFAAAFRELGGLARTLRGPVMSTTLGKVRVLGVKAVAGRKVLVLDFLQARDPDLVGRPFFAEMSTTASWFDQLRPATGDDEPFFPLAAAFGQPLDVTRTRAVAPMIEEV